MSKIKDLIPDNKNYNSGNEFGNSLIEKSLRNLGAGRSILIDKNNRIIAGNKTIENAMSIGLEDMQIVESDGTKIIAVKRTDIDLDSKKGRELALADNASAKANIVWNHENLKEDWGDDELKGWGIEDEAVVGDEDAKEGEKKFSTELDSVSNYVIFKFSTDVDWLHVQSVLRLEQTYSRRQNGKEWAKGMGRVVDGVEALELIKGAYREN